MPAAGVYLHIPFCKSRCSYCDFATDVYRSGGAVQGYVNALCSEIAEAGTGVLADTVYLGGGTPSMLEPQQVAQILDTVRQIFEVTTDAEITMEMNPATVTAETLAAYRELGIDRASFGVQTFNDRDLKLLARGHNAKDVRETFQMLRAAGFENVSFDLIAGLPGQALDDWKRNLDAAIGLSPEHISLYLLEIHEGTPLAEQILSERRPRPDEELAAVMYETMLDRLAAAGYVQYEISNFACPGFESRHNTKYWRLDPVLGFGVSAHSFNGTERYANVRDTARYVALIGEKRSAEVMRESIDLASEAAFLGLRLEDGIDLPGYEDRYGISLTDKFAGELASAIENGLLVNDGRHLRLTRRGKLYSNEVVAIFV